MTVNLFPPSDWPWVGVIGALLLIFLIGAGIASRFQKRPFLHVKSASDLEVHDSDKGGRPPDDGDGLSDSWESPQAGPNTGKGMDLNTDGSETSYKPPPDSA